MNIYVPWGQSNYVNGNHSLLMLYLQQLASEHRILYDSDNVDIFSTQGQRLTIDLAHEEGS